MILPSPLPPEWARWATNLSIIEASIAGLRTGGDKSFDHFRKLVNSLFCMTIGHAEASLHMRKRRDGRKTVAQFEGGYGDWPPVVRLTNDYYLRFVMALYVEPGNGFLKTRLSAFQYQKDAAGEDWVFRYDYQRDRNAGEIRPSAHLHLRSHLLSADVLDPKKLVERVHFPCGRPTIESTIRLLIDGFGVEPDAPPELWRPVLKESEDWFLSIAHKPEV